MADEEHLAILRQGVWEWNEWRSKDYAIKPDLSGATLNGVDLCDADLSEANLSEANLNKANFSRADLSEANLSRAALIQANLSRTNLSGANLIASDLSEANLIEADLFEADFSGAILIGANLIRANLNEAKLSGAILSGANLNRAKLSGAILSGANLNRAKLSEAILIKADFSQATLSEAILIKADFSQAILSEVNFQKAFLEVARLINAKLDGAILTEACLWETQRAGWSIKGVVCESVYWDEMKQEKTIYAPGEFERLFADKTRISLFYKDGISPFEIVTLPALIRHLEESHPGARLRFVSIKDDSGGAVVELALEGEEDYSQEQVNQLQSALEKEAKQKAEVIRSALAQRETNLRLEGEVKQLEKQLDLFVDKLIGRPTKTIVKRGAIMGDKYEISGQAGAVGPNAHAHDMTFNQLVNQSGEPIDLVALAMELSELRQAIMAKQDSSPQAAIAIGKIAEAEIAATEKNTSKVVEHLKAAGQWTLDFAKSIGKDVVVAAIKKAMGMG